MPATGGTPSTASDGSTLKVTAPLPVSPINDQKPETGPALLVVSPSTAPFVPAIAVKYRFQVFNSANTMVDNALVNTTSYDVGADLTADLRHTWRARAEGGDAFGPWSTTASFIAPPTGGYIKGSELYDPLINGKTVGRIHGPVTFIPGVGVRMDSTDSYIEYTLPQTLTEGEFSALVTNLSTDSPTEDPKNRILTMRQGDAQINDNPYRMSIDKRGNGAIAWRFLSGNPEGGFIGTEGAEREVYPFHEALTYFVQATWRNAFFNVEFRENGFGGNTIYKFGKPYVGIYQPLPHNVYVGSPFKAGDRGEPSTVEDMIIRQIWVSSRPRPSSGNR